MVYKGRCKILQWVSLGQNFLFHFDSLTLYLFNFVGFLANFAQ